VSLSRGINERLGNASFLAFSSFRREFFKEKMRKVGRRNHSKIGEAFWGFSA